MIKQEELTIPRSTLVAEYLLDGSAIDTNDGTKNNGTATNVTYANTSVGYQKQYGIFNGSSSKVQSGSVSMSSLGLTGTSISMSAWVYITGNPSGNHTIVNLQHTSGNSSPHWGNVAMMLIGSDDKVLFGLSTANNVNSYDGGDINTIITRNRWYHIVITYDNGTLKYYIDNVLKRTATTGWTGNLYSANIYETIGARTVATTAYTNGYIQAARIYSSVLTDLERQALYLEGKRKLGNSGYPDLMKDCVAYLDFRGDANDVIGGFNGTVTGATLTTDRFGIANSAYSFNGTDDKIAFGNIGTIKTAVFLVKLATTTEQIFEGSANDKEITVSSGTLSYPDWTNAYVDGVDTDTIDAGEWRMVAVTSTGGLACSATTLGLYNTSYGQMDVAFSIFFSTVKTIEELKALYQASLLRKPYPFTKSLPPNLRNGLKLHIDGTVSGTTAYDQSGNGNNGTLDAAQTVKRRFQSKNVTFAATDKISFPAITGIQGISAWIYPTANNKVIATVSSGKTVSINGSNVLAVASLTTPVYYVNGKVGTALTLNKWQHILVTFDAETSSSGSFGSDSFTGEMGDMDIHTTLLGKSEAQQLFHSTYIQ